MIYPLLLRILPDQLIKSFIASLPDREDVQAEVIQDPTTNQLNLLKLFGERPKALLNFILKEIEMEEQTEEFRRTQGGKHHGPGQSSDKSHHNQSMVSQDSSSETKTNSINTKEGAREKVKNTCILCKGPHKLWQCKDVLKLPIESRKVKLKAAKLCIKCLKHGHVEDNCTARARCFACEGDHHKILCQVSASVLSNLILSKGALMSTGHATVVAARNH